MKKFLAALLCAVTFQAQAGVVIDNTVIGSITNNFDAMVAGGVSGLISATGATYGERFAGQTINTGSGFDVITGTPTSLTLLANAVAASNIGVLGYGSGNVIYGDLSSLVGEGALSILLGSGSSLFGFNVVGTDGGGQVLAQFFRADGSLIAAISQAASDSFFGFRTTGSDQIWAVSLTNTDPAGVGYDNMTFSRSATTVPEPGTTALLALSLLCLGMARRKSK